MVKISESIRQKCKNAVTVRWQVQAAVLGTCVKDVESLIAALEVDERQQKAALHWHTTMSKFGKFTLKNMRHSRRIHQRLCVIKKARPTK
jgi:hypothetical protein